MSRPSPIAEELNSVVEKQWSSSQHLGRKYRNVWGEKTAIGPDFEELFPQEHDHELAQAQKLYGSLFHSGELAEFREEFLAQEDQDSHTISISQLEVILIQMRFMDEDAVYQAKRIRKFYRILGSQCKVFAFVHKAKNLIVADSNGSSDPFVKFFVDGRDVHRSSHVQEMTLNPVWEEHLPPFQVPNDSKTITLVVYDADFLAGQHVKNDYIGSVDIDMASVIQKSQKEESWYTLQCDPKLCHLHQTFMVTGEILVALEIQGSLKANVSKQGGSLNQRRQDRADFGTDAADLTSVRISFQDAVRILNYSRDEGADPDIPEIPFFPFDPDSYGKRFWDLLIMLLLLYTCFAVPVILAWGHEIDPKEPWSAYDVWDLTLDVLFCLDVALSFCTCFVSQGVYIKEFRLIARNYFFTWFWIEVPGSIPFDKIIVYGGLTSEGSENLKVLKFIRILKMVRAVRFLRMLDKLEERDTTGSLRTFFRIFRSIFMMSISSHFLGCVFIMLRDAFLGKYGHQNWMDVYSPELADADYAQQYVACVYWAVATVSTIGYGDVGPVNHEERMYTIFVAMSGVVIFAFSMANVTSCMQDTEGARSRFDGKMRKVDEYLHFRDVKKTLKRRILAHFGGCWRFSGDLYEECELVDQMPPNVRSYFFQHLTPMAQMRVPLLKGFESENVGQIFLMLRSLHFIKDEYIYNGEEPGGSMYFLVAGNIFLSGCPGMSLISDISNSDSIYRLQDLARTRNIAADSIEPFFGHTALFHEVCALRPEEAQAKAKVETLWLTRAMLDIIRGFCPEFYNSLFEFCLLTASRYGIQNGNLVFRPRKARTRNYPKIDQMCIDLRKELLRQHKEILTRKCIWLKGEDLMSPTSPKGRYLGTVVSDESTGHHESTGHQQIKPSSRARLVEGDLLISEQGEFAQILPSLEKSSSKMWKKSCLCVAESLDVWYITNEKLMEGTPTCMGALVINQDDFQSTCQTWTVEENSKAAKVERIERCGLVKKRGQVNTSYKERFFVLNNDFLEYYLDVHGYLEDDRLRLAGRDVNRMSIQSPDVRGSFNSSLKFELTQQNLSFRQTKGHNKGALLTKHLKVSSGTPNGVDKSNDGYHFTVECTLSDKKIECACADEEGRNMWVRKIHEASQLSEEHVSLCSSESRCKDKFMVPKCGCVFKVSNGPKGESKNTVVYIGCPTKSAATVTRTSILESASYYLKNCKSIRKSQNKERIISTDPEMVVIHKDLEIFSENYTYQQELAKIQADNSSKVQLLLSAGTHTCPKQARGKESDSFSVKMNHLFTVIPENEGVNASREHVKGYEESPLDFPEISVIEDKARTNTGTLSSSARSFSSGDQKNSFDEVENARLLRAKLERIEEKNKGDADNARLDEVTQTLDAKIDRKHQILVKQVDTLKEEVLTKLDVIMQHLQIQQFNHDHRHY